MATLGQTISYDIPAGYEKDIRQEDYHILVDTSVAVIAERFKIESVKEGTVQLVPGQAMNAFNLHNLLLKCAAVKDRSAWPDVIREHFGNIFAAMDEQKKIDPSNYETVKKYLSIRIYPKEMVEQRGGPDQLITRVDLEGTYTVLMLDLPGAFTAVQKKIFEVWKKDPAEVLRTAQDNVDSQKVEKADKTFDYAGGSVEVYFLGSDDYAASYALDLAKNAPEFVGEWGCAIAIPNKGLVSLCKISHDKPVDFVKYIQMSKAYIEKSYQEHPQRISDRFFWYYKGKFTPILVTADANGNVNVISPFGLTELMTKTR
jgi:hypothetical protein